MVDTDMTLERLEELVGAYGASAHRWPAAERAATEALLAQSADARALVGRAAELDALLDMAPSAVPSPMLVSGIMATRPRPASPAIVSARTRPSPWRSLARAVWPYGSPAFPAGALAASIMLGITFGVAVPSSLSLLGITGSATASVATSNGTGEQLVSLALAENDYPEEWQK